MNNVIPLTYEGRPVEFSTEGWLNATKIAKSFGVDPYEWRRLPETHAYLKALNKALNANSGIIPELMEADFIRTQRGRNGGTWLHPKLGVSFARWLSADFSVWCDLTIDEILHGAQSAMDRFNRACKRLDDGQSIASIHGRGLNHWKREKPILLCEIDRGRALLQLTLGLERPIQLRQDAAQ